MGDAALMARPRSQASAVATPVRQPNRRLIEQVLGDPSLYPDEMKAWMPRYLSQNLNMNLTESQLPKPGGDQVVGGTGAPTFINGWSNYGANLAPVAYYRDPFRRVFLDGVLKGGIIDGPAFNLPGGYRPHHTLIFAVASNDAIGICTVLSSGDVVPHLGSNVYFSLSGISFRQYG